LEVVEMERGRPLAIASCGNAAIAASVIARAALRPLTVYVPTWADESVVTRLRDRGAAIEVCPRRDDDPPGDPCVHRFREAVAAGAIPFSCQGPDNGLTIDGGRTLAYELVDAGLVVDDMVVQVGGGALASSVTQGFREAVALGRLAAPPRLHVVQAEVHAPMVRAWRRRRPQWRAHRSDLMWPWEPPGTSVATGILDDEVYDWAAVLDGLETTGGTAVTVTEDELLRANVRAREVTAIDVSPTGSAGLAGLVALRDRGTIASTASAAVLFTG
ncbi:MAG TPA: pyridoxal-phosphate dependent enzyme, partial [Acidimicrobiales bacterium]|nr:pyridoxal-phosphate dependent enzyme [Acidimicrobiales bacterium]